MIYSLDVDDTILHTRKFVNNSYMHILGVKTDWNYIDFNKSLEKSICGLYLPPTKTFLGLSKFIDNDTNPRFIIMSNRPKTHQKFIAMYIAKYYPKIKIIGWWLRNDRYFTSLDIFNSLKI